MTFALTRLNWLSCLRPCILSEVIDRVSGRGEWILLSRWHRATTYPVGIQWMTWHEQYWNIEKYWIQKTMYPARIHYEWHGMKNIAKYILPLPFVSCHFAWWGTFSSVLWKVQNNNKMSEHLVQQRAKYNRCSSWRNKENLIQYRSTGS